MQEEQLSITKVCLLLDLTPQTIKRWYRWVKKTGRTVEMVGLPHYHQDNRGTWFFNSCDLENIKEFQKI